MRNIFTPLSSLFLASLFLLLAACNEASQNALDPSVQILGRYEVTDTGAYKMGWPGNGVALSFVGTELSVTLTDGGNGIMDVWVNGAETSLQLDEGTHPYTIVESEKIQNFDVTITRRTEVFDTGLFEINDIYVKGKLRPYSRAERKLLFIGDSITAGFGVRGDTKDCQYNPETNAPYQAYAGLAARQFGARAHLIAISGRGVVHNWDANPASVMPAQIDYALPDNGGEWDHTKFMPDVIVTTLGTNDWSVINPGQDKFRMGYKSLLSDLRQRFPKAHIVTAGGPLLGGDKGAAIRDGIDWAMAELNDPNISTLEFSLVDEGLIWSCNSHPGRDSMKYMANQLGAHISNHLGWDYPSLNLGEPISPPPSMYPDGKAHFNKRVSEIETLPTLDGGVLLAGDSITEAWLWHKDKLSFDVSNHGVGWDTAEGLKARLPLILKHNPDQIFLMIGTNDIGYGHRAAQVTSHVEETIRAIRRANPNAKIYLQAILPRELEAMPQVFAYNAAYKRLARGMKIDFIDMSHEFSGEDGALNPELTDDGLHLNAKGYDIWAKIINNVVNSSQNEN
jgi:lysophospholipase L1-like esterase